MKRLGAIHLIGQIFEAEKRAGQFLHKEDFPALFTKALPEFTLSKTPKTPYYQSVVNDKYAPKQDWFFVTSPLCEDCAEIGIRFGICTDGINDCFYIGCHGCRQTGEK